MNCTECGKHIEPIKDRPYHFTECGLPNVYIYGITQYECVECSEVFAEIPKINLLHKAIGEILCKKEELLSGAEIRYLRKDMREKAVDFAQVLSIAPATLSRMENDRCDTSPSLDKLIRMTYIVNKSAKYDRLIGKGVLAAMKLFASAPKGDKRLELNPTDWLKDESLDGCAICCPA